MRLIKILILLAVASGSVVGQTWLQVCSQGGSCTGLGSSWPNARGFMTNLPYDSAHAKFIMYYASDTAHTNNGSIYSSEIWEYDATTHAATFRVGNGSTFISASPGGNRCAGEGSPASTWNPLVGHPLGYYDYDPVHGKMYATAQLCGGNNQGFTGFYDTTSHTFGTMLPKSFVGTGDGTFFMSAPNYNKMIWVSGTGANKAIACCDNGSGTTKVVEFDGVSTYTDVSGSVTGTPPPAPLVAMAAMDDGNGNLWIYGGCNGTNPGADSTSGASNICNSISGLNIVDLYKYNVATKVFTKMTPTGTPPITKYASFPFAALDKNSQRILVYSDNNTLKSYSIAGNAWSTISVSGSGPAFGTCSVVTSLCNSLNGNTANYDTTNNIFLMIFPGNGGQAASNAIFQVTLGSTVHTTTLTVQEMLTQHSDMFAGAARTNEPVCGGVAIPDAWNVTSTSTLGITGSSDAQFSTMATWPGSGNLKWVKACGIVPTLSSGGTANLTFTTGGSGNTGSGIATDLGATIQVATGTATFTLKKANHNGLDVVDVGGTHVVLTGTSNGSTIYGPNPASYPGNVTCAPYSGGTDCSVATGTLYTSKNDGSSTCSILENGPVMAMVYCTGHHKTSGGTSTYLPFKNYYYFYKNRNYVRVTPVIPNADYGTAGSFAASFKQLQGWDFQVGMNVSGTQNVSVGNNTGTPTTATVSGSDELYIYQGASTAHQSEYNASLIYPYTTDSGYIIRKNGGTSGLTGNTSGASSTIPDGWLDIGDSGGKGVLIGTALFGIEGSKSLTVSSGGTSARVGILASQNTTRPYTLEYPAWIYEYDIFLEFHATALSSPTTSYNKINAPLLWRQSVADYNTASVFERPMVTASDQDAYESAAGAAASPSISSGSQWAPGGLTNAVPTGCPGTNPCPVVSRAFSWDLENEYRFDYLQTFIQRGWTSRFMMAQLFSYFYGSYAWPHADGFHWYDHWDSGFTEVDGYDNPLACVSHSCQNDSYGLHGASSGAFPAFTNHNWHDQEHNHTWAIFDVWHLTGDQYIKDTVESQKNWYLAPETYQNGTNPVNTISTINGNPTITLTSGTWDDKIIGQNIMAGDLGLRKPYRVISRTNSTQVVVSPTPTVTNGSTPAVWAKGMYNTRALSSGMITGTRFYQYLLETGDSDATGVANQLTNLYNIQFAPDLCVAGYPGACDPGLYNNSSTWASQGVSRKRGNTWGAQGGAGTWCDLNPPYSDQAGCTIGVGDCSTRVNSSFQTALATEALLSMKWALGPSWSEYWNAGDLAYGISQFAFGELWRTASAGNWQLDNFGFGYGLDVKNACNNSSTGDLSTVQTNGTTLVTRLSGRGFGRLVPINSTALPPSSSTGLVIINGSRYAIASITDNDHLFLTTSAPTNASQTMFVQEPDFQFANSNNVVPDLFWARYATDGIVDATRMGLDFAMHMGVNGTSYRDWMGHTETSAIYAANNVTKSLTTLTPTVVENGGCASGAGNYCVTWTTPGGTDYLRVKYDPNQIVDFIGFDPASNSFTGNPANTNWFAATNATGIPSPVTGSQSMAINGLVTGLTAVNFSVKAFTNATCNLTPTTLGPWTQGQTTGYGSLTANNCTSSTYACTGLPTGLSINSSTGAITGTISASGTFTPHCTYSTAAIDPSILVNVPPTVTTSGAMPAGTQGVSYSQTVSTSGGTGAKSCTLNSGSLTGSGLTLNSNCSITGTGGTPTTYSFTVVATDSVGVISSPSSTITLTINGTSSGAGLANPGGNVKIGGSVK